MRPGFDKGTRPESFSDMVLELHAKQYTRSWLRYEREIAMEKHTAAAMGFTDNRSRQMFSAFDDEEKWDDKVPTGAYFAKAYKRHNATLRCHFSKEVKKQDEKTLA